MPISTVLCTLVLAGALAAGAAAQATGGLDPASRAGLPPIELVPIHTRADGALPDRYGIWAGGRDYKVSFHDGMVFYPFVGPDHAHRPVRWRTSSVRVGGRELLVPGAAPRTRHTATRFEYDHGHGLVVERYDVRPDGLEQSFVLNAPVGSGDLTIRGTIDSALALPEVAERVGPLELTAGEAGIGVVYGAAVAIDASGRETPVRTSSGGTDIVLRVPGAWLEDAAYPVVVDPLLGNKSVVSGAVVDDVDVVHETLSAVASAGRTWIVASRAVASGDRDLAVLRVADDFSGTPSLAYADTAITDATHGRIAVAKGLAPDPSHTVTAYQVLTQSGDARIVWHRHAVDDFTLQTNSSYFAGLGFSCWRPDIGGSLAGQALLVYQREAASPFANTRNSLVEGVVIDVKNGPNGSLGAARLLRPDANADQERPTVNRYSNFEFVHPAWVVAFQEIDNATVNDDWDITMVSMDNTGVRGSPLSTDDAGRDTVHKLAPIIAGERGRYCVLYSTARFELQNPRPGGDNGDELRTQRVDWDHVAYAGSLPHPSSALVTAPARRLVPGGIGYDDYGTSHWCATYFDTGAGSYFAAKLGYRGIATEVGVALAAPGVVPVPGGVAFNSGNGSVDEFLIVFGGNDGTAGGNRVLGTRMVFASQQPVYYGSGCGLATIVSSEHSQRLGTERGWIALEGVPADGLAFLMMSFKPFQLDLGSYGLPGCELLVDPSTGTFVTALTFAAKAGHAEFVFELPESLGPFRLHCQWLYPAPGANQLGLQASQGLRMDFRR